MKRILVIGCPGAGKSTLTRRLSERLAIPAVHLDRLYWREGWQSVPAAEFDAKLDAALAQPEWIIDGNFDRTLPLRLSRCDAVICLDYSRAACLWGVMKRVIKSYGRCRPDMAEGCPERFDPSFMKWIWDFRTTHGAKTDALLADAAARGVTVLRFSDRRQCARWLRTLPGA